MKPFIYILFFCFLSSCDLFESKEEKTQKLVSEQLMEIDWDDVDDYPLFSNCDEMMSKNVQKKCFEEKIISHLAEHLKGFKIRSETQIEDTVFIDFSINNEGKVTIVNIENRAVLGNQKQEFERLVTKSLSSLPKIDPALKRGIPVTAKFRIPIYLKSKNE